jgi:transcriptional regulator
MYVPTAYNVEDESRIEAFMRRYDFATLVTSSPAGLSATHVPLIVRRNSRGLVLLGHVARANKHWQAMTGGVESMAVFHGPHGYVSPTWYVASPAVPTWNYAVVHAYGRPRATEDVGFTRSVVDELVRRYELGANAWNSEGLSPAFLDPLLSAIVAFEMPVERIEAKFKLGQNRSREDRAATQAGLLRQGSPEASALADFMRIFGGD